MSAFHEGNKPLTEEYANKLKGFIRQAAKADKDFQVFGAQKHQYRLNPVVSPAQIKAFEQKYHVQLPEEYVFFLTHVGNGGAGPYYGLYSLEQLAVYTEKLQDYTEEDRENCPAFIDKSLTKKILGRAYCGCGRGNCRRESRRCLGGKHASVMFRGFGYRDPGLHLRSSSDVEGIGEGKNRYYRLEFRAGSSAVSYGAFVFDVVRKLFSGDCSRA